MMQLTHLLVAAAFGFPATPASAAIQELASWDEWVEQVNRSRILGGVHYRFSNEAGEEIGRRTARLALERVLQPLPASEARPAR